MEVEYKKDMKHNYMVITNVEHLKIEPYSLRVLEQHTLAGALPVTLRRMDNKLLFYYEITAKQSLYTILDRTVLTLEHLKKLCIGILQMLENAYEYLLPEEGFILSPEYIFIDITSFTPSLCYLPGNGSSVEDQMNSLMEYLMNKIDYNDKEAVLLVYQLYAVCRESGFVYEQFLGVLKDKSDTASIKKDISPISVTIRKEQIDEEQSNDLQIPVVMEKVESNAEILCYSWRTYLYCVGCIIGGIMIIIVSLVTKILFNSFGNQIDYSKLFALILLIICVEGYLLKHILQKKNKITKIIKTCEYIDPRTSNKSGNSFVHQPSNKHITTENLHNVTLSKKDENKVEQQELLKLSTEPKEEEDDINPTCLLNIVAENKRILMLKAQSDIINKNIILSYFPFFIGKFKKSVDYCLEKDVISRFHAKITQEGDHYYLTDLNSTNGTYINEEALHSYEKKEIVVGDEITFADIKYLFTLQ